MSVDRWWIVDIRFKILLALIRDETSIVTIVCILSTMIYAMYINTIEGR